MTGGLEPISVDKLTTDADGQMAEGFCEEMKKTCGVEMEHFLDTVHLNRSIVSAVSRVQLDFKLYTQSERSVHRHAVIPLFRLSQQSF